MENENSDPVTSSTRALCSSVDANCANATCARKPPQRQDPNSLTYRTLDISSFEPDTVEAVRRMAQNSRDWAMDHKIQQRRSECSQLLYEACDILFPSREIKFSLFTFRHQFIANMKSIMDRADVIAMVGAVDIDCKTDHYAKRRAAWDRSNIRDVPAPIEEQVWQIRRYLSGVEERETGFSALARHKAMKKSKLIAVNQPT
ncbi:hypothetical protein QA640_47410 (plasmid) [Bradyrhizobium sp. CB82]|uniref:hypothetical protein n=1 Tax=Bradyrhizobium sp. CB82 TaxID=3039159 RepID=UPI0024B1F0AA|nr:hypothetical protein [Bradyrhizobium sp. CB82]WFU45618.1 hypothetical protein QA640_47410 [Bradyrhizobium sp. CB82]